MPSSAARRGEIFLHRGDLTQARRWYEQAVTEARDAGSLKALSDALGNLGNVCALLEDHTQAEAYYREVLEIQRTLQEGDAIGETLVNLGNLKTDIGQPEKARAYYLEALDTLQPLENNRALGILYSNLALQELQLHNTEAAIEAFHAALEFANDRPPTVGSEHLSLLLWHTNLTGRSDSLYLKYGILTGGLGDMMFAGGRFTSRARTSKGVHRGPTMSTVSLGFSSNLFKRATGKFLLMTWPRFPEAAR